MKICQIVLVPALLLAFINQANASSGCDLETNIADGCAGLKTCTLSNGYTTGDCCTSSHLCDVDEGDCDEDSDCESGLICGTNNCASPFPDTHDCCTRVCSNYIVYQDEDTLLDGKSGTLTVEFSEDVTSWTIELTFDADITDFQVWVGTNIACSGSTCTFDNQDYNGEQSAGNTLDIAFLYSFVSSTAVISGVSITSEATAFCSS